MYLIGELADQKIAQEIIKVLKERHIEAFCQQKKEEGGFYQIWIQNEEHLILALDLFRLKTGGPRTFHPPPEWEKIHHLPSGKLTKPVIIICVLLFLLENFVSKGIYSFLIYGTDQKFTELKHLELWRLITPCLIHFGFLHLFFNLMWWKDLSKIIEKSLGFLFLVFFCLMVGILSNTSQYLISGPGFGGLSGIIFGLFGLVWMLGRFFPNFAFRLPKSEIVLMVGWFILCLTGALNFKIANMAHAVGLSLGMMTGILLSFLEALKAFGQKSKKRGEMFFFFLLSLGFIFLGQY